jgi:hypothetical protein
VTSPQVSGSERRTIYVVSGSTGEYSDRTEWMVRAFVSEDAAMNLAVKATARAKELELTRKSRYEGVEGANEHDPVMQMDYTGTTYRYDPVELDEGQS